MFANPSQSRARQFARYLIANALPTSILERSPALMATKYMASASRRAKKRSRPFMMINVGACDGVLYDDITPWLHKIANSRAILVEPVPYNFERLRANYPDTQNHIIEKVAITKSSGPITIKTFDPASIEQGKLPLEFVGCSSIADTNLISGVNAWGEADDNFGQYQKHLRNLDVQGDTFANVLARNNVDYVDALLIDCEGADWDVFEQFDIEKFRPSFIKIEIGALSSGDVGKVIIKLKSAGYRTGLYGEDVWAFSSAS